MAGLLVGGLAGCGQDAHAPAGPSTPASASPEPDDPASPLGVLLADRPSGGTLALVRSDGHVVARAGFAEASRIMVAGSLATTLPAVSASTSRLYYLDGDSDLRYLGRDGSRGIAARLPGTSQVHAGFAVSPDDRRIAVSLLDYSGRRPALRLYVEDLGAGTNRSEIFASATTFVWPVGWHAGQLALAVGQPFVLEVSPNPYSAFDGYHLVNPANAVRLAALGSGLCRATGPLSAAGTACLDPPGRTLRSLDWSGRAFTFSKDEAFYGAALSPDGSRVAACCSAEGVAVIDRQGGRLRVTSDAAGGWIDDRHLLLGSTLASQPKILDVEKGTLQPVAAQGFFVARLPGGF